MGEPIAIADVYTAALAYVAEQTALMEQRRRHALEERQQSEDDLVEHPRAGALEDESRDAAHARAEHCGRHEDGRQEPQEVGPVEVLALRLLIEEFCQDEDKETMTAEQQARNLRGLEPATIKLQCRECNHRQPLALEIKCEQCGGRLTLVYDNPAGKVSRGGPLGAW